ncbi:MAG: zf-HC2 domain-containing protein [Mariprofundales bacterium]
MNHYCRQVSRLVSDRLDRDLGWGERLQLWLHLVMCGACRNNARAIGLLHRVMGGASADRSSEQELDAAQRQHIAAALRQEDSPSQQ